MIKKMWALFLNGKIFSFDEGRRVSIYLKSIDKKELGKNEEQKPVWVTDRDPFENVRNVYEKFKHLDKLLSNLSGDRINSAFSEVWNALKKDLKNTEESG